jgi:hypothetical protein
MNFANAIRPKTNRQSTTNRTMLFVGVGRFSGKRAVGSIGDVLIVARNVLMGGPTRRDSEYRQAAGAIAQYKKAPTQTTGPSDYQQKINVRFQLLVP